MTREEKLDWLYRLKSEIFVFMPKEWLIPMADALDDAIKALEQEPILDKIRAEIDSLEWWCNGEDYFVNRKAVDCILNKYKAESEKA